MDKKELKGRLEGMIRLRESHLQDAKEISYVITGLEKELEGMKDPEENKELEEDGAVLSGDGS